jgi:oxygen-dependent protoporphyrinogen oxidase
MTNHQRLLIIGGGIAGLSAAFYAAQKLTGAQITLLEADQRWGGKIITERFPLGDGQFIIEGGPDTFLATKPWGIALCKELGLGERLHGTNTHQKNTYVLHRNRLQPLPDGLSMMIPTNIQAILKSGLISWQGKARMGLDFLLPPRAVNGDESLGEFVSRRLGREAYENLIEPLMSGIYAGNGDALSLASTFPFLRDLEVKYGSLARGALEMRRKMPSTPGSRSAFLTPTTGLAEMVEKLVEFLTRCGVNLRLNTPAVRMERRQTGYAVVFPDGEMLEANAVVLAAPAFVSGTLLEPLAPVLSNALKQIPYVSTATISLAYRLKDVPRPLDGYGYVIPRREGRQALACTWTSTKFPHRAPEDYALVRIFVGRAGQDDNMPRNEAALIAVAREELRLTLGVTVEPLLARVFIWEDAMPQYNLGHEELLKTIQTALEKLPGLALAGNGYRGIGIPDCIHSGQVAIEGLFAAVHQPSTTA